MTIHTRDRKTQVRSQRLVLDENALAELALDPEELAGSLDPAGAASQLSFPLLLGVSGHYQYSATRPGSLRSPGGSMPAHTGNGATAPIDSRIVLRETLRLDVDGRYPQMAASGTIYEFLTERTHWVARLSATPEGDFSGPIWYLDGDVTNFPYDTVTIRAVPMIFAHQKRATVTFNGPGAVQRVREYCWTSRYYHPCEFEYDTVEGAGAVTTIATGAHPNHPAGLPAETLSIETVYRRAGFNVRQSPGRGVIPLVGAGTNEQWSDNEMHDAMQTYWLRFADKAQWSLWTLFASLHETGSSLGGVMFDDIGPSHRQGTAVFNESFIKLPPASDPAPEAWVERMKFWTAVHEIGHTFNLAHSWQKVHPPGWGTSWTPLTNEPEARSFMNYPYNVSGGESAFFASFEYRFSDQELLFMRHAPEAFVQQGNALWFDHHGFEQTRRSTSPSLELIVRANRPKPLFEFMEPVVLELKLKNVSRDLQVIDDHLLATSDRLTVAIKKEGRPARQFSPYAQRCWQTGKTVVPPGESVYDSLFIGAGKNGWDVAEPGRYVVQVALHLEGEDIVSAPLMLKIAPPRGYEEEFLAQDLFTDDVGRVLAFDGTRVLESANTTLQEVSERLADRTVAIHARIALACPLTQNFKQLRVDAGKTRDQRLEFRTEKSKMDQAVSTFESAVQARGDRAAESLGHIDYADYTILFSRRLAAMGDTQEAESIGGSMITTLSRRGVPPDILAQVQGRLPDVESTRKQGARRSAEHAKRTSRPVRKGG
jgi:hypothetical protein